MKEQVSGEASVNKLLTSADVLTSTNATAQRLRNEARHGQQAEQYTKHDRRPSKGRMAQFGFSSFHLRARLCRSPSAVRLALPARMFLRKRGYASCRRLSLLLKTAGAGKAQPFRTAARRSCWRQRWALLRSRFAVGHYRDASFNAARRSATTAFVSFVIVLTLSANAFGQNTTGVQGHVTDEQSAAIKGAEVSLRSRSGGMSVTVTDDNGAYSFRDVLPGDYILEVKANGFADFASEEINLTRGQTLTTDVRLSARALNETRNRDGQRNAATRR